MALVATVMIQLAHGQPSPPTLRSSSLRATRSQGLHLAPLTRLWDKLAV